MNIVYLNGKYVPISQAGISPLDRGFLFGDGVYEIIGIFNGKLFRGREHLLRLQESLKAIQLPIKISIKQWEDIFAELIKFNKAENKNKYIYLQITRGAAKTRSHTFPKPQAKPTVFVMLGDSHIPDYKTLHKGFKAITHKDLRWEHCHIKTTSLLPNILLSQMAEKQQATEVILIRDGYAIEGSNSNLFIVKNGIIITPRKTKHMLGGITRELILELAAKHKMPYKIHNVSKADLFAADELWVTSAARDIMPIIKLDNKLINKGKVGPEWEKMQKHFQNHKNKL
jgi:D-alanine transaminase